MRHAKRSGEEVSRVARQNCVFGQSAFVSHPCTICLHVMVVQHADAVVHVPLCSPSGVHGVAVSTNPSGQVGCCRQQFTSADATDASSADTVIESIFIFEGCCLFVLCAMFLSECGVVCEGLALGW